MSARYDLLQRGGRGKPSATDVREAQRCALAWLTAIVHAVERRHLAAGTHVCEAERAELLDEIHTLRGLVLPALSGVFDIELWGDLEPLADLPSAP